MRRAGTILAAMAALALTAPIAAAVTAESTTIDVRSNFDGSPGTFTTDSDLVCASGTTTDSTIIAGREVVLTFHNLKTFICADGTGSFTLRIQARVRPCESTTTGVWSVAWGAGRYEDLRGSGSLVGTYFPSDACSAVGIDDHLTGQLLLP